MMSMLLSLHPNVKILRARYIDVFTMEQSNRLLEVCVDNLESAIKAISGGAKRLEICSSLSLGGLTPSYGLVAQIKKQISSDSQIYVMIRCKSGSDFHFTDNDISVMLSDVEILKTIGIDGFVFGALDHDGKIDEEKCKLIIAAASPLPVTFHRAFDVCTLPPNEALEKIASIGFKRILTSGKQNSAESDEALALIKNLISLSKNRVIIMPGSGINDKNVKKVLKTGVKEVHASCLVKKSGIQNKISMGKNANEDQYYLDKEKVEKIVSILNSF